MMYETSIGMSISEKMFQNYIKNLINKFFKILPIIENNECSIEAYLDGLEVELIGFNALIIAVTDDPVYLSLLSVYKWIADSIINNTAEFKKIRREVFHAISICKKLESHWGNGASYEQEITEV